MTGKSRPTSFRTAAMIASTKRDRFSSEPPYASVPLIGKGGEELVQQIAVGAVDLDGVEPRLPSPGRPPGQRRRSRRRSSPGSSPRRADRGRRWGSGRAPPGFPPAAASKVSRPAWWSWRAIFPSSAWMAAVRRESPGMKASLQAPISLGNAFPARIDRAYLRDDEPGAAAGPPGEIGDQAVAHRPVGVSVTGAHRGHDGPVLQGHAVDRDRGKEMLQFHGSSGWVISHKKASQRHLQTPEGFYTIFCGSNPTEVLHSPQPGLSCPARCRNSHAGPRLTS